MNLIENLSELRRCSSDIFQAALDAADPHSAVINTLNSIELKSYRRVFIAGAGKAGASMAMAAESFFKNDNESIPIEGMVVVPYGYDLKLQKIKCFEASHPIPDKSGYHFTCMLIEELKTLKSEDLLIFLLSGGASSLLCAPSPGISLDDLKILNKYLLESGADIQEINTVRKEVSDVKGGKLLKYTNSSVITMIISDVPGNNPEYIGSGPTVPTPPQADSAISVINKYSLNEKLPESIMNHLKIGWKRKSEYTVSTSNIHRKVENIIISNNSKSCKAALNRALSFGLQAEVFSSEITGSVDSAVKLHMDHIQEMLPRLSHEETLCIISGGETTVNLSLNSNEKCLREPEFISYNHIVSEKGFAGGRNMEFTLSLLLALEESIAASDLSYNFSILSAGTDGRDGPTDAAGAFADSNTLNRSEASGLDPGIFLRNHDSYHFFKELNDLLITGPTLTNVMDIRIILVQIYNS